LRTFDCHRVRLKRDGTRAETIFRLSPKRTSPVKSAGASVQSTAGSRGVRISSSNAGYTMFRGSVKCTGYPLHSTVSPSLPPPPPKKRSFQFTSSHRWNQIIEDVWTKFSRTCDLMFSDKKWGGGLISCASAALPDFLANNPNPLARFPKWPKKKTRHQYANKPLGTDYVS